MNTNLNTRSKLMTTIGMTVLLGTMASCADGGSGNVSKTKDGNCTDEFISSYKSVRDEASALKTYIDYKSSSSTISSQAQILKNACSKFYATHSNVSCNALVDYKEAEISSDDLKAKCEAADKVIELLKSSN